MICLHPVLFQACSINIIYYRKRYQNRDWSQSVTPQIPPPPETISVATCCVSFICFCDEIQSRAVIIRCYAILATSCECPTAFFRAVCYSCVDEILNKTTGKICKIRLLQCSLSNEPVKQLTIKSPVEKWKVSPFTFEILHQRRAETSTDRAFLGWSSAAEQIVRNDLCCLTKRQAMTRLPNRMTDSNNNNGELAAVSGRDPVTTTRSPWLWCRRWWW